METQEYADYIIRQVDRRMTYTITSTEEAAREALAQAMRESPEINWMIVRHRHIIERLV